MVMAESPPTTIMLFESMLIVWPATIAECPANMVNVVPRPITTAAAVPDVPVGATLKVSEPIYSVSKPGSDHCCGLYAVLGELPVSKPMIEATISPIACPLVLVSVDRASLRIVPAAPMAWSAARVELSTPLSDVSKSLACGDTSKVVGDAGSPPIGCVVGLVAVGTSGGELAGSPLPVLIGCGGTAVLAGAAGALGGLLGARPLDAANVAGPSIVACGDNAFGGS